MKQRGLRTTLVSIQCALLCGFFAPTRASTDPNKPAEVSKTPENPPGIELSPQSAKYIEVAAVTVQTNQLWGRRVPARVSLQTSAHVNVGAIVDGRVEQVLVRPGDLVQSGAPLLKIHSVSGGQARAEALQAINRLEAAEDNLRRFTNMFAKGIATQVELIEAETHAREARIDAERTKGAASLLGDGTGVQYFITAPTNGVVLSVSAVNGSALQPGADLVEIGDPNRVWIEAEVSEDDAAQMTVGQAAKIELPRTGKTINAKVETVGAQVDPVTRRRHVYLTPEIESAKGLTPGMLVDARLAEPGEQVLLPVEAVLIKEGDRRIVYVQSPDGKLRARDVLVATPAQGRVRVLQGLSIGERVVVKGALLVDGQSEQLL
jgi:cobalt-zinc-cadmium efflux system membrane fusion protein